MTASPSRPGPFVRRLVPVGLAAFVVAGCLACAPSDADAPAPSGSTVEHTPSASVPGPTASADALVIPDCEQLVPIEAIQTHESWSTVVLLQSEEGPAIAADLPGAAAADAASRAQMVRGCQFVIPQSGPAFSVYTLDITSEARADLVDALQADDTFTETDASGAATFVTPADEGQGAVSYTFVGDAWIVVRGPLITLDSAAAAATPAVTALRASNPGLDER